MSPSSSSSNSLTKSRSLPFVPESALGIAKNPVQPSLAVAGRPGGSVPSRLRQFVAHLHAHPMVCRSPTEFFQSQGPVGGQTGPAVQKARQRPAPGAHAGCCLGDAPAGFIHALADQFAEVTRVQHGTHSLAINPLHRSRYLSVNVVDQVRTQGFAAFRAEDHTPVGGDTHAPLAFPVALQGMQPQAGCVRVTSCE